MASFLEVMHAGAPALLAQMLGGDINAAVSAAGTNQATATALITDYSIVTTVASGTGVILPSANGQPISVVLNAGANPLTVYPASGETMNTTLNGGVQIAVGKTAIFIPHINRWFANISA